MYPLYNKVEGEKTFTYEEVTKLCRQAYLDGRNKGFQAGYTAALGTPTAKTEAAYAQGKADALKNGVGY